MRFPIALDPAAIAVFALNVFLSLTVVCLIALVAARRLFRHDPTARYYLCLGGLVCVLLSPGVVGLQQHVGGGLLTLELPARCLASSTSVARGASAAPAHSGIHAGNRVAFSAREWLTCGVWATLALWAAGVAWGAVRLIQGCRQVARLTRDLTPWNAPDPLGMQDLLGRVLGRPLPPIFTSPRVDSPLAVGLRRPVVILPEGLAETLPATQLRQALLHECAHVVFHHTLGGALGRAVWLLSWPHPLVRALCRELTRSGEEVCDNVASQEAGAACYARTLLALAQGRFTAPNLASALALLGPETSLEARIAGLLNPRRNRMVYVTRRKLWAVTGLAALTLGSTAMVRVVAEETKAKQAEAAKDTPTAQAQAEVARALEMEARAKAAYVQSRQSLVSHQPSAHFALGSYGKTSRIANAPDSSAQAAAAKQAAEAEARMKAVAKREAEAKPTYSVVGSDASTVTVYTRDGKPHVISYTPLTNGSSATEAAAKQAAEAEAKAAAAAKLEAEAKAKTK